jgi:hypothetical protein
VGVVFEENGIETVRGKTKAELLTPELSAAVITTGKFCRGWASEVGLIKKETGFVRVSKPLGKLTLTPALLGGPETLVKSWGVVPGLAVTETCTVALVPGVTVRAVGKT